MGRGQVNSIDLAAASVVFIIMLSFLLMSFGNSITAARQAASRDKLEHAAISATDLLIKTPGTPGNWEQNASLAQSLGLASTQNILMPAKLSAFSNLSYSQGKGLLGLDSGYYFYVEDLAGSRLYEAGNASYSASGSVSVLRYALVGNTKVRLRLVAYG